MCRKGYTYIGTDDFVDIQDRFILFLIFVLYYVGCKENKKQKNKKTK